MHSGDGAFILFLLVWCGLAAYAGSWVGIAMFYGGWGRRLTHSCGWFKWYIDWGVHMQAGRPCPRCGKSDGDWHYRVGRPVVPGIWQWQDRHDPITTTR